MHDQRTTLHMIAKPAEEYVVQNRGFSDWIGPTALGAFAYIGQLKGTALFAGSPVDLTLLTGAAVLLAVLVSRLRHGPAAPAVTPRVVLVGLLVLGMFRAPLEGYSLTKIGTLYTFTLVCMLAPFYLLRTRAHVVRFLLALVGVALAAEVLLILAPGTTDDFSGIMTLEGSNTIGTARVAGTGFLICVVAAVGLRMSLMNRLVVSVVSGMLIFSMFASGRRGPFLAIVIALLSILFFTPGFRRYRARFILLAAVIGSAGIWWAHSHHVYGFVRVIGLFAGDRDASTRTREYIWVAAWHQIQDNFIGVGWGGFPLLREVAPLASTRGIRYPHNILLEVFVEAGWLAGLAFLVYLIASIVRMARSASDPLIVAMFGLLTFTVANAMVSGDVNDNRLMWILLSFAWIAPLVEQDRGIR